MSVRAFWSSQQLSKIVPTAENFSPSTFLIENLIIRITFFTMERNPMGVVLLSKRWMATVCNRKISRIKQLEYYIKRVLLVD